MGHPTKKPRDKDAPNGDSQSELTPALPPAVLDAAESDDEYEDLPARSSKQATQGAPGHVGATTTAVADAQPPAPSVPDVPSTREVAQVPADATDDDWLRSRTSRLLDLVDPDDPGFSAAAVPSAPAAAPASEPQEQPRGDEAAENDDRDEESPGGDVSSGDATEQIAKTSRLFLRNLSYSVTEDDIREHFSKFGPLDEVCMSPAFFCPAIPALYDESLDRDSLCRWHMTKPWAQVF